MRSLKKLLVLICTVLCLRAPGALCDNSPRLVVSVNPLASILGELVDDRSTISTVVSARVDPHMFELRPAQLKTLSKADLFFTVGLGLEFWAKELPLELRLKTVELAKDLGMTEGNPHIWLVPEVAGKIAQIMKSQLCKLRPAQCSDFTARASAFDHQLGNLDQEIREKISHWKQRSFVSYHPAWSLFAQTYGLKDLGSLRQGHSSEISIVGLKYLIDLAHQHQVEVFFMEPGADTAQAQNFLKESGMRTVLVDDLGMEGKGYFELMRRNLFSMDRGMQE